MENQNTSLITPALTFKRPLVNALEAGSKMEINFALKPYKLLSGHANFPALFTIPSGQRLPALAKQDMKRAFALVGVGVTMAMESLNLSRPMNANQLMDLTDAILETAEEDNLSLEDLLLFLQKLTRGEYGAMYESMDIPKFMLFFEKYREDRFQAIKAMREEQSANHRPDYSDTRLSEQSAQEEKLKHVAAVIEHAKMNQPKQQP